MTEPRDWDKEMAEIDKIIASGKAPPPAPAPQALPAGTAAPRSSSPVGGRVRTGPDPWA